MVSTVLSVLYHGLAHDCTYNVRKIGIIFLVVHECTVQYVEVVNLTKTKTRQWYESKRKSWKPL